MTAQFVIWVLGWLCGWWAFGRPLAPPATEPLEPGAPASGTSLQRSTVVIPVRDEEASIGRLLSDLAGIDAEVIVVDDNSTDATVRLVEEHPGTRLLHAPALRPGWTGKCAACATGAEAATGGTLVFLDADVRISSSSLRRLIDTQRRVGGLVSVQPWHDVERPYQRLSIMFNIVAVMGSAAGAPEPSTVFGPVLITDVSDYKRVGGHAAVRGEVVEDLALGRQYRELDIPTTVFVGDRSVAFRMYSNGIAQLIEGWTKNFALGAGATPIGRMSAIVLWVASLGTASIRLGEFLLGSGSLGAVAAYALSVLQFWVLSRRVGRFGPASALLLPLHLATFLLIFARSAWCTVVRRRVTWRGRSISLNEVADPR